ncbi:MAG: hypothetical protein U9Q66_00170 [Patescibacteria group bacterium]|nr:hypothetical protein [Patescibacteria group bacterium]
MFIVILLISIITYIYSNNIKADQINLKSEILSLQTDIETLKTSKEVTVYNLIELNESYIASLDKISDINNVVTNIVSIEEKF